MHLAFTLAITYKMYELHFSSQNPAPESDIRHSASSAAAAGAVLPGVSLATHSAWQQAEWCGAVMHW